MQILRPNRFLHDQHFRHGCADLENDYNLVAYGVEDDGGRDVARPGERAYDCLLQHAV
jgi:hypothetical protein